MTPTDPVEDGSASMEPPRDSEVADHAAGEDTLADPDLASEVDAESDGDEAGPDAIASPGGRPQPWAWHVVRVSGLFLAALVVGHVVVTFVMNDVGQRTAATVAGHWHDATWRALEWVTLVLALAHGGLGLDTSWRRGSRPASTTTALRVASGLVIAALIVTASVVVLTYR